MDIGIELKIKVILLLIAFISVIDFMNFILFK